MMCRFKAFYNLGLLSLWLIVSCCQPAATLPEQVVESIEKRIENGINPSISIGVIDEQGVKYYNFGKTRTGGQLVDEHTIYEIGSISKVFTGILLAQQSLEGKISLDDPVNEYLPSEVAIPVLGPDQISFGNLADHTSGLPRMPANFTPANPNNPYADYSVEQMYAFISTYTPTRSVGSHYEYSNLAQGLLGHVLALNAGVPYETLLIRKITAPLGMEETKIVLDQNMKDRLAVGHSNGIEVENWDIPTLAGAGGIRSSTADMLNFLAANLGHTQTSLQAAMDLTHKPRHDKAGDLEVGLGWHIKESPKGAIIWHNGGTGGYRAFAGFVKETGKGVVVFTNSTVGADDIGFHLLDSDSELREIKTKADAVQLPEETLKSYVGKYRINPNLVITITRQGQQLYGQANGEDKAALYAMNSKSFYLVKLEAQITFQVSNGKVESLTLYQGGQELTGKKTE